MRLFKHEDGGIGVEIPGYAGLADALAAVEAALGFYHPDILATEVVVLDGHGRTREHIMLGDELWFVPPPSDDLSLEIT